MRRAAVGVTENANTAVLVTVADGQLLDRREVHLTHDLPTHPHHHEGSWAIGRYANTPGARKLSLEDAVRLVDEVRAAAERGARECLETLAASVSVPIDTIAIRACPELPPTIEERIRDNRAQTYADSVMYRQAIANAAKERGWSVRWYDQDTVVRNAERVLGRDVNEFLAAIGRTIGPPWQAKHRLAAAAAIATRA